MSLKHVATNVSGVQGDSFDIHMRLADTKDAADAKEFVELKVPVSVLSLGATGAFQTDDPLARFKMAALRYVRDALDAEIERFAKGG